jgi:Tfp pilus assembly protein PilV
MRARRGMSLAEIMVAAVILVSCVLLLMGMFSVGAIRTRQARAVAIASFLARQKMEEALTEGEIEDSQGSCDVPFESYGYTVTKKESTESSLLERIEVTVTAPSSLGSKQVKLVMLRAI